MSSWPDRSLRTLTVYYERGVKALEELKAERYEEADVLLNMRKAAFHNFRSADFIALKEGYPAEVVQELETLWKLIDPLDAALLEELKLARDRMESQLVQLAKVRAALNKFRSSETDTIRFEKSV